MELQEIINHLEGIEPEDVPKNVKKEIECIIACLKSEQLDVMSKVHKALSTLDELSNDPNIMPDTRTQLWNISSLLESISQ